MAGWWLSPTPLKNMTLSVGSLNFPIYGKIIAMFQTTSQMVILQHNHWIGLRETLQENPEQNPWGKPMGFRVPDLPRKTHPW